MINDVYTNGFQVLTVSPLPYSIDNDNIGTSINIEFNNYINNNTVSNNILLLKDDNNLFNQEDLSSIKNIEKIDYFIEFDNLKKSISLSPVDLLEKNKKYIILVLPKVKDVEQRLIKQYFSVFYTNSKDLKESIKITHPVKNSVLNTFDYIELEDLKDEYAIMQLSKHNTFETVCFEKVIKEKHIVINKNLDDGSYYLRIKSNNTNWSEPISFYVNPLLKKNNLLQQLEANEFCELEKEDLISFLETSPSDNIAIDTKRNLIAFVYKGKFDLSLIDIDNTVMYGELIDEDDRGTVTEHGLVDFDLETVYFEDKDETYVIVTPQERGV